MERLSVDKFKYYASVDIETTGLNPHDCVILQIGIVLDDLVTPLKDLPKIELLVLQETDYYPGESTALVMNRNLLERISHLHNNPNGTHELHVKQSNLGLVIASFLQNNGWEPGQKITFAGKNFATFDAVFLDNVGFFKDVPARHRTIDVGSMYWVPHIDGMVLPNLAMCMERAGLEGEVAHTALADAMTVVKLIRSMKG